MLDRFPNDEDLPAVLLQFYVATNDTDTAQSFLREIADTAEGKDTRRAALTTLVRLVLETDGRDAALVVLDSLIDTQEDPTIYSMMRASMMFDAGQQDDGISEMEALLETETTRDETIRVKVTLAQMLIATGDSVGARARVEEVLESNATQPDALKIKAGWLIESDETEEALSLLRLVLDQDDADTGALSLTALAYARNGDRNLTREFLALAVESSNAGASETLRYADLLIEEERYLPAEEALLTTLRQSQGNPQILQRLGTIYLQTEDWGRAEQVEDALKDLDEPLAERLATALQAARLATQGQMEDAVAFLETYAAGAGQEELSAQAAVVQARLVSGDTEGALAFAEDMVASSPDDLERRFVLASIQSATGDYEASEQNYRQILDQAPQAEQAWINLIRMRYIQGDVDGAEATLQEGLAVLPEGINLLWAQASFNERSGDIDGAIDLYELIYERAPNDLVAANNLASLIATYREGDESLERAYAIARRLRGSEIGAFQDTYGWIAYRRGDLDEALDHLEPAAQALQDDPLVQFHLAMTYVALERDADALPVFQRALEIAGPDDTRSQFDNARTEVARIEAAQ
jgi:tetratricopeptide (TPR) repeat protein